MIDPNLNIGDMPVEQEIASGVISILQRLRSTLQELNSLQATWNINQLSAIIQEAAQSNQKVAGFSPTDWLAWNQAFNKLQYYLNYQDPDLGNKTLLQILFKRYSAS